MTTLRTALVALLLLAGAVPAPAAEQRVIGTRLLLRTPPAGAPRLILVAQDAALDAPAPGSPGDPRIEGATLELRTAANEVLVLPLPAGGWKLTRAGRFQFRGSGQVQRAILKDGLLRVTARPTGFRLDEPSQGAIGVVFRTPNGVFPVYTVCASFDRNIVHDGPGRFAAKKSIAPAACPAPPPPVCGNGVVEAGERCDGPGSPCGGGAVCAADCTCPCDFLDQSVCAHPFPTDWLTIADPTTDTGRRVHFHEASLGRNVAGVPIVHTDYNWNDGFSPGTSIVTFVPDLDLAATGGVPITDIARSFDPDQPIVVLNATTRARHLIWAELDANASSAATQNLIIRPAVNFDEATRYIVALRKLRDASGRLIPPSPDFRAYRDGIPTGDPVKEARRPHMEALFATLEAAGIPRHELYLAWDFTTASRRNLTERLLFMRDDAFARLGAAAPAFVVEEVENDVDDRIYRRVTGTYFVERYVNSTTTGARMELDANGLPIHQPTPQPAVFICNIPRAALAGPDATAVPARASLYGHGLLGSPTEVNAGNVRSMANEHNFVFCATRWIGMAQEDIPTAVAILQDLGKFPALTDRLQQAMLNQLFLARLMIHPEGFVSDPAFQDAAGNPVIDRSDVFFDGNSQGGIFGGTLMAVAQDITRGVLGVPGMNYSTLLTRSVDFDAYSAILYPSYPNELERPAGFALIQMLWDRSDPNGYAHHMTDDPLPNTPPHEVLLHVAFGDHQVANVTAEVEARTIGAHVYQPALAPGRHSDVQPYFGIPAIPSFPFDGSAMIVWDSGTPTPPTTNTPPRAGEDPHEDPRAAVAARIQKSEFLKTNGAVVDVCGGAPCVP